jgi:type I restriction enzyme S subunit
MSDELPNGWAMPLLGEVVKIKQGNSKLTKKWFKPDGKYVAFSGSGPDGLVDQFDHEGKAIVLSSVGARCGKCFKADGKWTAIANTAVIRPLLVDDSHYEYLFYLLNNENFWPKGGTAQPFVQTGLAQRETRMPLAPLAEQRRIVAKLEKLLGQVDACQQRLVKMPTLLKRFRQSVLAAACSGRLTADWREENPKAASAVELLRSFGAKPASEVVDDIPESWCWGIFGELVTNHDGKRIPVKQSDRDKRSGPYPYYGAFGIIDDIDEYIYDGDYLLLAEDGKNLESRLRPISLIASSKFWVNNHAHVLQAKGGIPLSYLNAWLNSPSLDLSPFLTGIDQVKLNRAAMDKIPVPVAPLAEQQEIVRRVTGLFALADQLEQRLAQARKQVDKLTPSLLARAFSGKLVPQDPADEPASILLKRIHAHQNS